MTKDIRYTELAPRLLYSGTAGSMGLQRTAFAAASAMALAWVARVCAAATYVATLAFHDFPAVSEAEAASASALAEALAASDAAWARSCVTWAWNFETAEL